MDNECAKLILQAYRANGADAGDPYFDKALEQARLDPALRQWFASQQAFDLKMCQAIESILPPPDLKEAIIHTHEIAPLRNRGRLASRPRLVAFALVTSLVLLFAAASFVSIVHFQRTTGNPSLAAITEKVLDLKRRDEISLGAMNTDPEKLRSWLADRGAPSSFTIPSGLIGMPALGCQSYQIDNLKVSLICFTLAPNQIVHLFIINSGTIVGAPSSSKPKVYSEDGIVYATWSQGGQSYILTGDQISADLLRQLVRTT